MKARKPGKPGRKGGKARPAPMTRAEQESPASGQPGAAMGADDGEDEGGPVFAEGFPGEGMVILENLAGLFERIDREPEGSEAQKAAMEVAQAVAMAELREVVGEIIVGHLQWRALRDPAGKSASGRFCGRLLAQLAFWFVEQQPGFRAGRVRETPFQDSREFMKEWEQLKTHGRKFYGLGLGKVATVVYEVWEGIREDVDNADMMGGLHDMRPRESRDFYECLKMVRRGGLTFEDAAAAWWGVIWGRIKARAAEFDARFPELENARVMRGNSSRVAVKQGQMRASWFLMAKNEDLKILN